jgi:hypothetical protein
MAFGHRRQARFRIYTRPSQPHGAIGDSRSCAVTGGTGTHLESGTADILLYVRIILIKCQSQASQHPTASHLGWLASALTPVKEQ